MQQKIYNHFFSFYFVAREELCSGEGGEVQSRARIFVEGAREKLNKKKENN